MAGFQDIIGHNQIVDHLKNAIRMEKISHAYILNGEKNAGKMMLKNIKREPIRKCAINYEQMELHYSQIIK